ncbi:hypothetical protein TI39_contig4169g00015 [Zymoseptoria brevis]|uniref:Cep57 centrosome microtubule-binding domain-containing protein n=1 Tax=Zymoseptoria brevis TaxID=1047168 RepID=A0A0F4GB83_9PEZI|nr:hypothetical protein TI39_contig4169g00015 [Zymoseptoria brevis]
MAQASRPRNSSRFVNKTFHQNDDSRASSPADNEVFTTATGFSMDNVLHSTPQQQDFSMPLQYDQYAEPSEHSSDMSIELGRGVKRAARQEQDNDRSSSALFSFGNDNSMYDLSPAQPPRQAPAQRHSEGLLRKDATIRRATESARANDGLKRSTSIPKQRAVSDNSARATTSANEPVQERKASRGRFSAPHISTRANIIPIRYSHPVGLEFNNGTATGNLTTQTTQTVTYTNNQSFALPNVPNIAELISGVRTDATPVKRASRSRFASASLKPQPREHLPVQGIAVPEDERAIYASLQTLKDRINQLEAEKSDTRKREEDYENELMDLRSRVDMQGKRPDSGVGMENEINAEQHSKLQAEVKALQERLNRSERKTNVSDTAMSRITKERDALVVHIGSAYARNEQLVEENEALKASEAQLEAENERLREEVHALRETNNGYLERLDREEKRITSRRKDSASKSEVAGEARNGPWNITSNERTEENSIRSRKEGRAASGTSEQTHRRKQSEHTEDALIREITSRIEREMQNIKENTLAEIREARRAQEQPRRSSNARSRSRSQRRGASMEEERSTTTTSKRYVSAPAEMEVSGGDSTTDIDVYRKARPAKTVVQTAVEAVEEDLTVLSELDFDAYVDLRKKLEQELRDGKLSSRRKTSTHKEDTTKMSTGRLSIPRKSSMKDIPNIESTNNTATARTLEDILKISKTVRVQSPHSSDFQSHTDQQQLSEEVDEVGDTSTLSNTSRRRRRSGPSNNLTSAFIVPDITFHQNLTQTTITSKNIPHEPATCTGCTAHPAIPTPCPVSTREELADLTTATIRPSQDPDLALAEVIKKLEDEVTHLKLSREKVNRKYNAHDPAVGRRRRAELKAELERLTDLLEKRCDLVYGLYDVLEGRKPQTMNAADTEESSVVGGEEWGAALSGRKSRSKVEGLPDLERVDDEGSESEELPWEGISESGDDESLMGSEVGQRTRRSSGGF